MDADIAWDDAIPDLPLDATASLPPLNALSAASTPDELPNLDLLDLFSLDNAHIAASLPDKHPAQLDSPHEKLSDCTDLLSLGSPPSTTPSSPPSSTHHSESTLSEKKKKKTAPNPKEHSSRPKDDTAAELVAELSTRLESAGAEATALRKRVASLTAENRGLRHALDHANARLVAVAQAAAMHPPVQPIPQQGHQPQQPHPVMLGLAQVPADVASRVGGVLTVSSTDTTATTEDPRERKKRKRMAGAATTMACVMFMWGAFVGTPGLLKGTGSYRSEGNLPAVWTSSATDTAVAPVLPNRRRQDVEREPWQPNCMRVLEQLPHGKEGLHTDTKDEPVIASANSAKIEAEVQHADDADNDANKMFVDMADEKAANVVAHADDTKAAIPDYSYVLCRDSAAAMDSIKACRERLQHGKSCGQPHTISLILPAAAAGLDDDSNGTHSGNMQLAEVQCTVMSVARIPSNSGTVHKTSADDHRYGKVIASVAERNGAERSAKTA